MTDDDPSRFDGGSGARADADSDGYRGSEGSPDDDAPPAVDEDLQEVVEYDLADLEEDEDDPDYPGMDDPVDPQSINVENATFVVLGVLGMVGLILYLLLGAF